MEIKVLTTQNVEIEYEIASIADRFVALLIDYLIIFGVLIGVYLIVLSSGSESAFMFLGFAAILAVVYPVVCETLMQGQTFGKRQRRIKVIKMDGTEATFLSYFLRWVLGFVDHISFIGVVVMLINGKGQRLGDLAAGTTVIRLRDEETLGDTVHISVEPDYVPEYPQVTRLTDADLNRIKSVMDQCIDSGNIIRLTELSRKVQEVLGIETTSPPYEFLMKIVKDYNYYAGRL